MDPMFLHLCRTENVPELRRQFDLRASWRTDEYIHTLLQEAIQCDNVKMFRLGLARSQMRQFSELSDDWNQHICAVLQRDYPPLVSELLRTFNFDVVWWAGFANNRRVFCMRGPLRPLEIVEALKAACCSGHLDFVKDYLCQVPAHMMSMAVKEAFFCACLYGHHPIIDFFVGSCGVDDWFMGAYAACIGNHVSVLRDMWQRGAHLSQYYAVSALQRGCFDTVLFLILEGHHPVPACATLRDCAELVNLGLPRELVPWNERALLDHTRDTRLYLVGTWLRKYLIFDLVKHVVAPYVADHAEARCSVRTLKRARQCG